ncbi:hypothetical protein Tco_0222806 [Tanacetum coccineum]
MQQLMPNLEDITDPTTAMNMALVLMAKVVQNAVQNPGVQNVRNQNGLIVVSRIANPNTNQNRNGNIVAAQAEGNGNGNNGNQIRCYNCRGLGDLEEIEEVNENCILMANLQQASISSTQTDKAPVYDSDGSTEIHHSENYYDNDIFIMFTQEEHYTELLEPISEPHQHDPPAVYDSEETLQLAQESHLKMKQSNKEIKLANYAKINHLLGIFVSQKAKSREELYFSNISKTASVSKSISIPNEEFLDDTTPSVARKFLNEVKTKNDFRYTHIHNWSSTAHQEIHKIIKDEILPIVNQVDARVQNFEIQFLKEAAKFVRDFKSLAKEADESLAKHKTLEFEIEYLLRAVVSQDIMSIVQSNSVVDTSNLKTELDCTKEKLEN